MEETTLNRLHTTLIEILDEIDRICKKHNITYFLVGGTMLGAVRHGGFIPWDDDLDIGMTRNAYEKFIKICSSEFSEKYYITTPNARNYHLQFAKVQMKNTLFIDNRQYKRFIKDNVQQGIFVDIFPYDNVINKSLLPFRKKMIWFLSVLISIKLHITFENKMINSLMHFPMKLISFLFSLNYLKKLREHLCKMDNTKKSENIVIFGSPYSIKRSIYEKQEILPTSNVLFEGKLYPGLKNVDYYLNITYGEDYMELPPLGERITHNPAVLCFDTVHEKPIYLQATIER